MTANCGQLDTRKAQRDEGAHARTDYIKHDKRNANPAAKPETIANQELNGWSRSALNSSFFNIVADARRDIQTRDSVSGRDDFITFNVNSKVEIACFNRRLCRGADIVRRYKPFAIEALINSDFWSRVDGWLFRRRRFRSCNTHVIKCGVRCYALLDRSIAPDDKIDFGDCLP